MSTIDLPLADLADHPENTNTMPGHVLDKLKGHIERTRRYPPLVVRPRGAGGYQIIDGHHRAKALRSLGAQTARCVVWEVDDEQTRVLLATLNRLEGRDDPRKRAALAAKLRETMDLKALAARLPEDAGKLGKLLELTGAPRIAAPPRPTEQMPVAVHFFLCPDQRRTLEAALARIGGQREAALMRLVEQGAGGGEERNARSE